MKKVKLVHLKVGDLFMHNGTLYEVRMIDKWTVNCQYCDPNYNINKSCYRWANQYLYCDFSKYTIVEVIKTNNMEIRNKLNVPAGYVFDKVDPETLEVVYKKSIKRWMDLESVSGFCYSEDFGIESVNNRFPVNVIMPTAIDILTLKSTMAACMISQLMPYYGGEVEYSAFGYNIIQGETKGTADIAFTKRKYNMLYFKDLKLAKEFLNNNEELVYQYLMIK